VCGAGWRHKLPRRVGKRYLSDLDDIGNAISNENPSFETGSPGSFGSPADEPSALVFEPASSDARVWPAIGSFVKAGACHAGRASEVPGPAFFGRIYDLHKTSYDLHKTSGFYEIGSGMASRGLDFARRAPGEALGTVYPA
jgi:hypothetical protein